jgi:hypothetical protein
MPEQAPVITAVLMCIGDVDDTSKEALTISILFLCIEIVTTTLNGCWVIVTQGNLKPLACSLIEIASRAILFSLMEEVGKTIHAGQRSLSLLSLLFIFHPASERADVQVVINAWTEN